MLFSEKPASVSDLKDDNIKNTVLYTNIAEDVWRAGFCFIDWVYIWIRGQCLKQFSGRFYILWEKCAHFVTVYGLTCQTFIL